MTRLRIQTACAAAAVATALAAQPLTAPAGPKFDVVSIRTVPRNAPPTMREQDFTPVLPGGQFIDSRVVLGDLIAFAYGVKNYSQVVGLPGWAQTQSFAVAAKPADGFPLLSPAQNREQVRLMMQALLADRFHLKLHTEARQTPVFKLEVARGGMKIKEVDPPVPPAREGHVNAAVGDRGGRMIGNKSTMAGMALALTIFLKRPVIDETGLKGYYDFDVQWSAPEAPDGPSASPGLGTEGVGLLMSALQSRFGLRLRAATGPVAYWVVDYAEPPTEN